MDFIKKSLHSLCKFYFWQPEKASGSIYKIMGHNQDRWFCSVGQQVSHGLVLYFKKLMFWLCIYIRKTVELPDGHCMILCSSTRILCCTYTGVQDSNKSLLLLSEIIMYSQAHSHEDMNPKHPWHF